MYSIAIIFAVLASRLSYVYSDMWMQSQNYNFNATATAKNGSKVAVDGILLNIQLIYLRPNGTTQGKHDDVNFSIGANVADDELTKTSYQIDSNLLFPDSDDALENHPTARLSDLNLGPRRGIPSQIFQTGPINAVPSQTPKNFLQFPPVRSQVGLGDFRPLRDSRTPSPLNFLQPPSRLPQAGSAESKPPQDFQTPPSKNVPPSSPILPQVGTAEPKPLQGFQPSSPKNHPKLPKIFPEVVSDDSKPSQDFQPSSPKVLPELPPVLPQIVSGDSESPLDVRTSSQSGSVAQSKVPAQSSQSGSQAQSNVPNVNNVPLSSHSKPDNFNKNVRSGPPTIQQNSDFVPPTNIVDETKSQKQNSRAKRSISYMSSFINRGNPMDNDVNTFKVQNVTLVPADRKPSVTLAPIDQNPWVNRTKAGDTVQVYENSRSLNWQSPIEHVSVSASSPNSVSLDDMQILPPNNKNKSINSVKSYDSLDDLMRSMQEDTQKDLGRLIESFLNESSKRSTTNDHAIVNDMVHDFEQMMSDATERMMNDSGYGHLTPMSHDDQISGQSLKETKVYNYTTEPSGSTNISVTTGATTDLANLTKSTTTTTGPLGTGGANVIISSWMAVFASSVVILWTTI